MYHRRKLPEIPIKSDSEEEEEILVEEINYLKRQITQLKWQMRRKYTRLEEVRVRRAVKMKEREMKEKTKKFLPTLENVIVHRERILHNSNQNSENSDSDNELPSVKKVFNDVFSNKKDSSNN